MQINPCIEMRLVQLQTIEKHFINIKNNHLSFWHVLFYIELTSELVKVYSVHPQNPI